MTIQLVKLQLFEDDRPYGQLKGYWWGLSCHTYIQNLVLAASKLWSVPPRELHDIPNLHTFKSNLKMYLFKFPYG